ncbi:MAG: hypothetical protein K0V04_06635 [Deltaproteobacteria bacterium]|nr:hypothetical protein [Deltaproteobacteria bacterium]
MKFTKAALVATLTTFAFAAPACDKKEDAKKEDKKADAKKDDKKGDAKKEEAK